MVSHVKNLHVLYVLRITYSRVLSPIVKTFTMLCVSFWIFNGPEKNEKNMDEVSGWSLEFGFDYHETCKNILC